MIGPLDDFRMRMLSKLSQIPSFEETWPFLEHGIKRTLGGSSRGVDIFRLGDALSALFLAVPEARKAAQLSGLSEPAIANSARTQQDVSTGGVVWECLVAWYLNFVCYGTDLIASKRTTANTPSVITDAISVTLHGYSTTTESDLVIYSVPEVDSYADRPLTIADINRAVENDTNECAVAIVQCKTNWNDNAQIPMLWDLIYRSLPFVNVSSIQIGRNGVNPRSFREQSIKYAFMTVPTNQKMIYKVGSVPVTRVLGLSGGNYWGKPTKPGVATGFSDFLNNNFSAHFQGSIQNHIDRQLSKRTDLMDRFLTLNFV